MKVLIVDDEQPARQRLVRLLDDLNDFMVVGEAANGFDAINQYNDLKPEIILLDIRMPKMDGLEAAQHLSTDANPPAIIFTTAYNDHALAAFESHAVDYLLKPIRKERLLQALKAAINPNRAQMGAIKELNEETESDSRSHICIRNRGNLELVAVQDIYYFKAEDKYVTLKHANGQALIEESLVKLEEEFNTHFMRVHRNALVAIQEINGLEKSFDDVMSITLKNCDDSIEVSRRHLPAVRKFLKQ